MKEVWIIGANSDVAKEMMMQMNEKYKIVAASRNICAVKKFIKEKQIKNVLAEKLDVCDQVGLYTFLNSHRQPDIIIFAQGMLETGQQVLAYLDEMVQCNYISCIQIIEKVWADMLHRRSGCIIGITSVAVDRGKMSNKLYASTKAALSIYLQALMQEGEKYGVQVVDVKSGYIKSKMLKNNRKAYVSCLAEEPAEVASCILKKMESKRSGTIYVKKVWRWVMLGIKIVPERIYVKMRL